MSIAFVGSADLLNNAGATNSLIASYTVGSGANRLLVVGFLGDAFDGGGFDDITSVTYAGAAMTLAVKTVYDNGGTSTRYIYLYFLLNPTSGTNNVVISATNTHYLIAVAADYTGVQQTGQPDATASGYAAYTSSPQTLTTNITTVAGNSWLICVAGGNGTDVNTSGNTTSRVAGLQFKEPTIFDSNADLSAGSNSFIQTSPSTQHQDLVSAIASFAPDTPDTLVGAIVI